VTFCWLRQAAALFGARDRSGQVVRGPRLIERTLVSWLARAQR